MFSVVSEYDLFYVSGNDSKGVFILYDIKGCAIFGILALKPQGNPLMQLQCM